MPLWDDDKESYWMLPGYMKALEMYGAIPMMLPLTDDPDKMDYFLESCDGFLLTGGHDIDPAIYGEERHESCEIISEVRDAQDIYILRGAVERDKPVLGICRGLQLMNAVYGGTLYQDIPTQYPSDTSHRMSPPYDVPRHQVEIVEDSPLHKLFKEEALRVVSCQESVSEVRLQDCLKSEPSAFNSELEYMVGLRSDFCDMQLGVNSLHHQGIKDLSPHFKSMAKSPDGLIEAIYMPDKKFVWAVQWHPEFSYKVSRENQLIMRAFVEASSNSDM